MTKRMIYFLCTGNSCRSQMAEAFARAHVGKQYDVYSAGIEAHGLHPSAIQVMNEVGIDISQQTSDTIDPSIWKRADFLITLCGDADERCPNIPFRGTKLHWGFDDPARIQNADQAWHTFRRVRDEIERQVIDYFVRP